MVRYLSVKSMSLYNPPGDTSSWTINKDIITQKLGNIHIRRDSLGSPLAILRSQDREGNTIRPQKIHMTQCLLGELISSAKVQTENPTVYHTTPIAIFAALRFHLFQGAEWGYWNPGLISLWNISYSPWLRGPPDPYLTSSSAKYVWYLHQPTSCTPSRLISSAPLVRWVGLG